jgi:Flp pilus assembly protein TadB
VERVNALLSRHLWLQLTLSVLVASALVLLLFPGRSPASVLVHLAFSSLGGIAVVIAVRRKEKRAAGSTDGLVALDRKLRRGEVPTAPEDRQAMRDLVEQRLHRTRHRVAAQIFLAVLCGAVLVLTALTAGARQTVGFAVFSAVFVGWLVLHGNLQHRRLRTMRAALTSGAPQEPRR